MSCGLACIAPREPATEGRRRRYSEKSHAFAAECLAWVEVPWMEVKGGVHGLTRPSFAVFCASDSAMRAFEANLRLGRRATIEGKSRGNALHFEFLRSVDYSYTHQRIAGLDVLTIAEQSLMEHTPPGDVDEVFQFLCIPPADRVDGTPGSRLAYARPWLSNRCTAPMPNDPSWHDLLHAAMVENDMFVKFSHAGLDSLGYAQPLCVHTRRERFEALVASIVPEWHRAQENR